MIIPTTHIREQYTIKKQFINKKDQEDKFTLFHNIELPSDISQINEYFLNLQKLNPRKLMKENLIQNQEEDLIQNENLIVIIEF
jgi:hypothetical protein